MRYTIIYRYLANENLRVFKNNEFYETTDLDSAKKELERWNYTVNWYRVVALDDYDNIIELEDLKPKKNSKPNKLITWLDQA